MNWPSNLFLLISSSSLGIKKLKCILQSLIVSVFTDLKSFIKNRVTTKSSDLISAFNKGNILVCRVRYYYYYTGGPSIGFSETALWNFFRPSISLKRTGRVSLNFQPLGPLGASLLKAAASTLLFQRFHIFVIIAWFCIFVAHLLECRPLYLTYEILSYTTQSATIFIFIHRDRGGCYNSFAVIKLFWKTLFTTNPSGS